MKNNLNISNTENQRFITRFERDVFKHLHILRNTGKINVYEAQPYLVEKYTISEQEANDLLNMWLENFREDGSYRIIVIPKQIAE